MKESKVQVIEHAERFEIYRCGNTFDVMEKTENGFIGRNFDTNAEVVRWIAGRKAGLPWNTAENYYGDSK